MWDFLNYLIIGVLVGSIYGLIALGFVIINKATGVLNVAQGGLVMMGAFICFFFSVQLGLPFFPAVLLTLVTSFFLGMILDRILFRPMVGQPELGVVMMTIGLLWLLDGIVVFIWGPENYSYPKVLPSHPIVIKGMLFTHELLWSFITAAVMTTALLLFFRFSRIGVDMRAVADDQQAAQAAGVSVKYTFSLAWGIGNVVAAVGGILFGVIAFVFFGLGFIGMKVLPVVILGGLESIGGAIAAGVIVGVLENLAGAYLEPYLKGIKEVAPFFILILILVIKPHGLFGLKRIERI
ncbi:MAG: branched-chain amino acid ABC transporter permease [Thermodesulfobacteriota bacterium]|nr:branched-chain amino acid ABC transporter permease [Thermodesulfobacteriota bacterium]